jgi:hypothetical protein
MGQVTVRFEVKALIACTIRSWIKLCLRHGICPRFSLYCPMEVEALRPADILSKESYQISKVIHYSINYSES